MFKLRVVPGVLTGPGQSTVGHLFSPEDIERLNAISDRSMELGVYTSLHTQRFMLGVSGSGIIPADGFHRLLHDPITQRTYGIGIDKADRWAFCHGRYYGYAACCIKSYDARRARIQRGEVNLRQDDQDLDAVSWWDGTGFRPCPVCALLPEAEVVAGITSRRMAWSVFPESRSAEAFQSVDFLEKFCSGALRSVEATNG